MHSASDGGSAHGFEAVLADLRAIATRLQRASDLPAEPVTPPDAGATTPALTTTLDGMVEAVAEAMRGLSVTAADLDASAEEYDRADARVADRLAGDREVPR
jgi:hypothetical protein